MLIFFVSGLTALAYVIGRANGYEERCNDEEQENAFWKELEKRGLL